MVIGGLWTAACDAKLDRQVEAGSEEVPESDLKRGRGGDVWVSLQVDPNLADRGETACEVFADTSTSGNTGYRRQKD